MPWQAGENERERRRELLRRRNEEIKLNGGPRGETRRARAFMLLEL